MQSAHLGVGLRKVRLQSAARQRHLASRLRLFDGAQQAISGQLSSSSSARTDGAAPVVVYTVSTIGLGGNASTGARVRALSDALEAWHVEFHPIGVGEQWVDFQWLAKQYASAVSQLSPERVVVTMDSSDIWAQASSSSIRALFDKVAAGRPIVLALETGCSKGRCTVAPGTSQEVDAATNFTGIPDLTHINGGFVIGRAGALHHMWTFVANNSCCRVTRTRRAGKPSAQLGIGRFVSAHPGLVAYDRTQQLCANVVNVKTNEYRKYYELVPLNATQRSRDGHLTVTKVLRNAHSRVVPAFVHYPGTNPRYRGLPKINARLMEVCDDLLNALSPTRSTLSSGPRRLQC